MSSVCIFSGWACAACIVGLQAASKNKSKVRPEVGYASWDRLEKNVRPKSGWTTRNQLNKTYGFWVLVLSHTHEMYPLRFVYFFFVPNLGCEVHFVLSQPAARFVPPEIGWTPPQPQDLGCCCFFSSELGGRVLCTGDRPESHSAPSIEHIINIRCLPQLSSYILSRVHRISN